MYEKWKYLLYIVAVAVYPFSDQKGPKTIPFGGGTYPNMAYLKEYAPLRGWHIGINY